MRPTLDTVLSTGIVIAALAVAIAIVHREFAPRPSMGITIGPPTLDKEWRNLLPAARLVAGDSNAAVQIVEFGDFECPYCKHFEDSFDTVEHAHGDSLALWFIQFPLDMHRFAKLAAHAAECAGAVGAFIPMSHVLFAKQDSFGFKPWDEYAHEAGVANLPQFDACLKNPSVMTPVDSGLAMGNRFVVRATPTILINGWRYAAPPSDSLEKIVERTLKRGAPYKQ